MTPTRTLPFVSLALLVLVSAGRARGQEPAQGAAPLAPELIAGSVWTGETYFGKRARPRDAQLWIQRRTGDAFEGEWSSWSPEAPDEASRWIVAGVVTGTGLRWHSVRQVAGPDAGGKTAEATLEREGSRFAGSWRIREESGWAGTLWITASPRGGRPAGPTGFRRVVALERRASAAGLLRLAEDLPDLARLGVTTLVLRVDYDFAYASHPELVRGGDPITRSGARGFADACAAHGIRLVPRLDCVGRQGRLDRPAGLLAAHPEFSLLPRDGALRRAAGIPDDAQALWDPGNDAAWDVVLALLDELLDAFGADAIHVGLTQLELLRHPRLAARVGDPEALLRAALRRLHAHLVTGRGVELWLASDGLGTLAAGAGDDALPRDLLLCVEQDAAGEARPTLAQLAQQGFGVVAATSRGTGRFRRLLDELDPVDDARLLGVMFTRLESARGTPLSEAARLVQCCGVLDAWLVQRDAQPDAQPDAPGEPLSEPLDDPAAPAR